MGTLYAGIRMTVVIVLFSALTLTCGAEEVQFEGKVVDVQGAPVTGAKVTCFSLEYKPTASDYDIASQTSVESDEAGKYVFTVDTAPSAYTICVIIAEKKGFGLGWANRYSQQEFAGQITLAPAGKIGGVVLDQSGAPVSGAEVRVAAAAEKAQERYLVDVKKPGFLTTQTDAAGAFAFNQLPENAGVMFQVSKPGKGTVLTYNPEAPGLGALQYSVGQTDIKITLPDESVIEGKVIEKATGNPVPGIHLVTISQTTLRLGKEPAVSAADGSFRIDGLCAGSYSVTAVFEKTELAPWITKGAKVELASGEVKKDIEIALETGAVLEVTVTEEDGRTPIEGANVLVRGKDSGEYRRAVSDKLGKVRMRLVAGDYQLQLYKQGMKTGDQQQFTIETGQTMQLSASMTGMPKVTGQVLDPQGQPLADARIVIMPGHQTAKSDAQGNYSVAWDSTSWGPDTTWCLVARHEEKGLAFSEILEPDTKTMTVKMETGWILTGTIVDAEGKPIEKANPMLMLRAGNWGSTLSPQSEDRTDAEGRFTIRAIPPQRQYYLYARAEGYGKKQIDVKPDQFENGQLDLDPIALPTANLSVSGTVVDTEGNPVKGADIYGHGDGQPDIHNFTTDAEGKFVIKPVCQGRIRLTAHARDDSRMYGSVQTEGGAEDVTIVIGYRSSSGGFVAREPGSLKGKPLPAMEGLGLTAAPSTEGKAVAICFWDMNQRPSRHFVIQMAARAEALNKRFSVLLVSTSSASRDEIAEWLNENGISWICESVGEDLEKTKFAWGVKGLPWLILTDEKHVVLSEGLTLAQLDEALKKQDER